MSEPLLEPKTWKVIRVDGEEELHEERARLLMIAKAIDCQCFDSVILTKKGDIPDVVMLVDDTGMLDGRPVNPKATELYRSICKPGTLHSIHGDVALVHDEDFA